MGLLIIIILIGIIPAAIAQGKGKSFVLWWFYGSMLFIVALPHALIMKRDDVALERIQLSQGAKKCPHCAEIIKEDAKVCKHCGRDV